MNLFSAACGLQEKQVTSKISFKDSMSGTETKTEVFTITDVTEERSMSSRNKKRFEQYVQPCLAELFGTALFVFVGCSSVVGYVGSGLIPPALAHGLALGVLIMVFGPISGGHFNPAVSLSIYLCGGMKLRLLPPYILSQMVGGMIGAGLTKAVYPIHVFESSLGGAFLPSSAELVRITVAEMILTLILTMVVCMGAVNNQTRTPMAPFCIGLTVTANIFAGGILSGGCMNPARAFGPAVVANHWGHHWVYWVGPTCGALVTAILIRLLFGDHKTRIFLK